MSNGRIFGTGERKHYRMGVLACAAGAVVLAMGLCVGSTMAASGTWSPTAATSDWGTLTNWSGNLASAPGDTTGASSATTESATFNSNSTTLQVNPGANRAIRSLTFGTNAGNYVIGPAEEAPTLYLTGGGTINDASSVAGSVVTINSPLHVLSFVTNPGDPDADPPVAPTINKNYSFSGSNGASLVFNGDIYTEGNFTLQGGGEVTVTFNGSMSGTGRYYSNSSPSTAKVILKNANTNTGGIFTDVTDATFELAHDGAVTSAPITAQRGGNFVVSVENAITGSASVSLSDWANASNVHYGSSIVVNKGNNYTGGTTMSSFGAWNAAIPGAELWANNTEGGSATGTGDVNINKGVLGGEGTIDNSGTANGVTIKRSGSATDGYGYAKLSPGASAGAIGTLTIAAGTKGLDISGAVQDDSTGSLLFDLGATGDLVDLIAGQLKIGTGYLEFDDFIFNPLAGFGARDYTLFSTTMAINGLLGDKAKLSGTIGGLTGTIGLSTDGHSIILSVVPEPASLSVLALGAMGLLARRRRMA